MYSVISAANFAEINADKQNFDDLYLQRDPRDYFKFLGQLDYIIPHIAQPVFEKLIRARAAGQPGPVTVLDLGSSYGVNGALLKHALSYDALRARYTLPELQTVSADEILELDRNYYRSWPKRQDVRVIGLDVSRNAIEYAQACGAIDHGIVADLETGEPSPSDAAALAAVDLIVSTGCVGYVTSKTFERVMAHARSGRTPWVASFVLRMFPYDRIATTLAEQGLITEKFEGATFVQRRFANRAEMEATIGAVERRGIDTRGHEANGLYHAELFISRPRAEVERCPIQKLVSVVSGANKPWAVGTNVLGGFGPAARQNARAGRSRLTLAPKP
jgi:hypothetical protein